MANGKGIKFYLGIFIIVIAVIELVKLSILSRRPLRNFLANLKTYLILISCYILLNII